MTYPTFVSRAKMARGRQTDRRNLYKLLRLKPKFHFKLRKKKVDLGKFIPVDMS